MRPEVSLLHVPLFLLLSASGLAAVMTVAAMRSPGTEAGAFRKLLRFLCILPAVGLMLMATYLVWISMGPLLLALFWLLIFVMVAVTAMPSVGLRLDALGIDRLLFGSLFFALLFFVGALAYLILVARVGVYIRLI
jgi:hypothetical protein